MSKQGEKLNIRGNVEQNGGGKRGSREASVSMLRNLKDWAQGKVTGAFFSSCFPCLL